MAPLCVCCEWPSLTVWLVDVALQCDDEARRRYAYVGLPSFLPVIAAMSMRSSALYCLRVREIY